MSLATVTLLLATQAMAQDPGVRLCGPGCKVMDYSTLLDARLPGYCRTGFLASVYFRLERHPMHKGTFPKGTFQVEAHYQLKETDKKKKLDVLFTKKFGYGEIGHSYIESFCPKEPGTYFFLPSITYENGDGTFFFRAQRCLAPDPGSKQAELAKVWWEANSPFTPVPCK